MTTVREAMTSHAECIKENETIVDAARKMARLDVGALPICGSDNKLKGMLTDRDIVVNVIASGMDPATTLASSCANGTPVVIDAEDTVDHAIEMMEERKIRRLPVLEGRQLVGIVSQGDIATIASHEEVGEMLEAISGAPAH